MKIAIVTALTLAGTAAAQVNGFTETFETSLNGWAGANPGIVPTLTTEGGNSFARTSFSLSFAPPPFDANTVLAGLVFNSFSGGAFQGNYLAAGIDTISFDVRHDSATPLVFSVRLAQQNNFPAVVALGTIPVASGSEFTTLSFDLSPTSPLLIPEAPTLPTTAVLADVQNIQIVVTVPEALDGQTFTYDIDNVTITPAPSGFAAILAAGGLVSRRRRA